MDTTLVYRSAAEINSAMARVYNNMALAIISSMVTSYLVSSNAALMSFLFGTWVKWLVIFIPIVFVFVIPLAINAGISKLGAQGLLHVFAALMGVSFATIFVTYQLGSIVSAFFGAAILFGTLSFYGYFTKKDLSSWAQFLFIGLIAIIIASLVNIFIGSTVAQMTISALAIIIFLGLTAYDTQQIREMVSSEDSGKQEVLGALTLYLNFINIFLSLLQLFGDKKE